MNQVLFVFFLVKPHCRLMSNSSVSAKCIFTHPTRIPLSLTLTFVSFENFSSKALNQQKQQSSTHRCFLYSPGEFLLCQKCVFSVRR